MELITCTTFLRVKCTLTLLLMCVDTLIKHVTFQMHWSKSSFYWALLHQDVSGMGFAELKITL